MTLGAKLKRARKESGLSQEQLSEKLIVSRSAIAKWESDKGMPDIDNLKAIARLFNTSLDYLLDEDETVSLNELKEPINLNEYEKTGKCRNKNDAVVLEKFSDATSITPLIREKILSKVERILEWTIMPTFGIFKFVDQINHSDEWYLVERDEGQYIVCVSKESIISTGISKRITEKTFVIGKNKFTKLKYKLISCTDLTK